MTQALKLHKIPETNIIYIIPMLNRLIFPELKIRFIKDRLYFNSSIENNLEKSIFELN